MAIVVPSRSLRVPLPTSWKAWNRPIHVRLELDAGPELSFMNVRPVHCQSSRRSMAEVVALCQCARAVPVIPAQNALSTVPTSLPTPYFHHRAHLQHRSKARNMVADNTSKDCKLQKIPLDH
jgi:hypothetical protein